MSFLQKNVTGRNYILDAEAVGYDRKTGKYLPFQSISQRIKRKYNIPEMAKKFPVELNVFDVLYHNDKNLMNMDLANRRKILEKIVKPKKFQIITTEKTVTDSIKEAEAFFQNSLDAGNEGVMAKNISSVYKPGRYVGGWCKIKPTLEPLDLVITGAEYGTGRRAGFLSSFVIACLHADKFLECGMVSTGLKEKETKKGEEGKGGKEGKGGVTIAQLTKLLRPLIREQDGRRVLIKPKIVIEVGYEEIQKSPTYSSGFALRFPRFLRLRTKEKAAADANSLDDLKRVYHVQRARR